MQRNFNVFGEPVELLVTSASTGGCFSIGRQTCKPGSGVPPHIHQHEDEVFSTVSGVFEIFDGEHWTRIPPEGVLYAPRGMVHCFRNCGETPGTIQFTCGGSKFDSFLEGLSRFTLPDDMQAMIDYSASFGITYPTLPPPAQSAS